MTHTTADLFAANAGKPLPSEGKLLIEFEGGYITYMKLTGTIPELPKIRAWLLVETMKDGE